MAKQLQDVDMFDSKSIVVEEENTGAIYNDFDHNPLDLLGRITNEPCYSQSSNLGNHQAISREDMELVPRRAVEHALLEADQHESIFCDFLSFQSNLYDIETVEVNLQYMEKVYKIATVEKEKDFDEIVIDDYVTDIFDMRRRNNWKGADSVYDAWLIVHGYKREWFPYSRFFRKYPDAKEKIEQRRLLYENRESYECDTDIESQTGKRKADENSSVSNQSKKYLTASQVEKFFM